MLSIIVPVYNVKQYVEKCLNSLGNQRDIEYEVIVVDDGSTDTSDRIVDEFCSKKDRFKVIHKENGGLMSAWMEGLKYSKGDYIGFVDSDDYVEEDMFSQMYKIAIHEHVDMVMCNHVYEKEDGSKILHKNPLEEGKYNKEKLGEIMPLIFPSISKNYISPGRWNKIIKKNIIEENLKYLDIRITSGEDANIILPCMMSIESMYYIAQPLYHYISRETSISNVFKEEILDTYSILIGNISKAICEKGIVISDACKNLYNFYGYLWILYVTNSSLTFSMKIKQIRRMINNRKYVEATSYREKNINYLVYKCAVRFNQPWIFLLYEKVKKVIRKRK